jgi:hypothetical protein
MNELDVGRDRIAPVAGGGGTRPWIGGLVGERDRTARGKDLGGGGGGGGRGMLCGTATE